MKITQSVVAVLLSLIIFLSACSSAPTQTKTTGSFPTERFTEEETYAEATIPTEKHSPLYIEGVAIEDVITYFNEVCLDAEFVNSGNASLVQKWVEPIYYMVNGNTTEEDMMTLTNYTDWLNTIEGFPGIYETNESNHANLQIYFCSRKDLVARMGENHTNSEAAVTFWYTDDEIYSATICYRTDLDQPLRNSVILEEIYNGLGPIQDTQLRLDSIIYTDGSQLSLTDVDKLILQLLYNPMINCGMNAEECEKVIRQLYY